MAHNIFGQRFYNRSNTPAWHGKGINQIAAHTATAALEKIGNYDVELRPLRVDMLGADGSMTPTLTNYAQLIRKPTADDPQELHFGSPVHKSYELITPTTAANLWDETIVDLDGTTLPVETLGVLGKGQELFITSKIVRFQVAGDDLDMYIGGHFPMYSDHATNVFSTAVRIVCQNTLKLGLRNANHRMIIPHTPGSTEQVKHWLKEIYRQQSGIVLSAKVDMEKMAATQVRTLGAKKYLEMVYPNPEEPKQEWVGVFNPTKTLESYRASYAEKLEAATQVRETVLSLFGGEGVGMDTRAVNGTLFGLYNAVAEFEDCRRGGANESTVKNVLVGDRAGTVTKAYEIAVKWDSFPFSSN